MSLDYRENNQNWNTLLPVLDEHGTWFHDFVEHLFYPDELTLIGTPKKPTSFAQWVVYANRQSSIQPEIVEKLTALHADVLRLSDVLLQSVQTSGVRPPHKDFNNFMTVYEEFMIYIRRLEKDLLTEGSGYDSFTGLRNKAMLNTDVTRELDRLARQGKSFCLALARIDNFADLNETASADEMSGYIKLLSSLIKLSVRSFDDAYYFGDGEFALCLKQTDVTGGISALERLRSELERQKISVHLSDGKEKLLSMSCCIAEPVDGDKPDQIITNLRNDLATAEDLKTDTVLKYHEMSPLQRYVREGA